MFYANKFGNKVVWHQSKSFTTTFPLNGNIYFIINCTLLRYIAYYMTTQQQNRSVEAASLQKHKLITLLKNLMFSQKLLQLQIKSILDQNTSGVERLYEFDIVYSKHIVTAYDT